MASDVPERVDQHHTAERVREPDAAERLRGHDASERLREHGLNVTAQRIAVLDAITESPHATADAIAESARERIGAISRQTVYDALGAMVDSGLVRKIEPAGSSALYEDRVGDNHHHLVCRQCDCVVDVDCATGDTPCLTPVHDAGFSLDEAEVMYWGLCPSCQTASDSAQTAPGA